MSKSDQLQIIHSLIGAELSSVEFIRDYVQFQFDGPVLTSITPTEVHIADKTYRWGDCDYRNKLCEQISSKVIEAIVLKDKEISIKFNNEVNFSISLDSNDYEGPEAALLKVNSEEWWIW